jgi:signal transduction histidine kinase
VSSAETSPLILYVDDEAANRVVFESAFSDRFHIRSVSSAQAALDVLSEHVPAVVVSDQRMPGMSGTELLSLVRDRSPDSMRVILTAYSDPESMLEAINKGEVSRYLVKPWSKAEMVAVLNSSIETFQLKVQSRELSLQMYDAQRFSMIGLLSATLAHDMTSPLSAIVSNLERLAVHGNTLVGMQARLTSAGVSDWTEAERDAADELPVIAKEVRQSADYLTGLVQSVRAGARANKGDLADPRVVLEMAATLARGVATERGGKLLVAEPASNLPRVKLSTMELMQVLVNLLTNAAQALHRKLPERRVQTSAAEKDDGIEFVIADTGPGMTPEQVERAGRVRFTTKPDGQGTGLGLTICRQLVEQAGGKFTLKSELGNGTTVTFWLPKA